MSEWKTGAITATDRFTGESHTTTYRYFDDGKTYCSWCNREVATPSPYFSDCCDGECGKAELRDLIKSRSVSVELEDELAERGFERGGSSGDKATRAYDKPEIVAIFFKHYGMEVKE